jgi:hypothetical protein
MDEDAAQLIANGLIKIAEAVEHLTDVFENNIVTIEIASEVDVNLKKEEK